MIPHSLTLFTALALGATAAAQNPLDFTIDNGASQYVWTGTTSLGPLLGNPSNNFGLSGNFLLELDAGITNGEFKAGGVAVVSPDISGRIPNSLPFLPDLATIDIANLTLEFTTPSFAIGAGGSFSTQVTVTVLSGMLTVTPLVGSTTTTDLTGTTGGAQPMSGNVTPSGGGVFMTSPQSSTFSFTDAASGMSASITLTGTLQGDNTCQGITNYCSANPNSTGLPAFISASGSTSLSANSLTLIAGGLPAKQFGYFLFAPGTGFVPNFGGSSGNLCLSGSIVRFSKDILNSGNLGSVAFMPDMNNLPSATVWSVGETQHFQYWSRDVGTSNTTDGLTITFCP